MIVQSVAQNALPAPPEARTASASAPQAAEPVRAEPVRAEPAAATDTVQQSARLPSAEELQNAVAVINQVLKLHQHNLQFSVDSESNRTVVKMIDTDTGELIRQYPSEATLAISRSIDRLQQGLLLSQKV